MKFLPVNDVPRVMNGTVEAITANATVIDLLDLSRTAKLSVRIFNSIFRGREGSLKFINSHEVRFTPELEYVGEFDLWYQVLDADGAEEWRYLNIVVDSVETIDEAFVECDGLMI